jgi:hypothetical protein
LARAGYVRQAADLLERHLIELGSCEDPQAVALLSRLATQPNSFRAFDRVTVPKLAVELTSMALAHEDVGEWASACTYREAALVLDRDQAHYFSSLERCYAELGEDQRRRQFYTERLRVAPLGRVADLIRDELRALPGVLLPLELSTSFDCEAVRVNGTRLPGGLSAAEPHSIDVPIGTYRLQCIQRSANFATYIDISVDKGRANVATFEWAIVENQLEEPAGFVVVETGNILRVTKGNRFGVEVPRPNVPVLLLLLAEDGTRYELRELLLPRGGTLIVDWAKQEDRQESAP